MMGLWADGWFYISSAGLLISGVLFFFLLGQYRVASEAADATEADAADASAPVTVHPVYVPEEKPSSSVASHPAFESKPEPNPEPKTEAKDPSVITGGVSPAVVYMQNIKTELAALHDDVRALAKRVDNELGGVSTRDEALIERLTELTRAVEAIKQSAASAPAAAPAPAPAPAEPAPKKARKDKLPGPPLEIVVEVPSSPEPAPASAPAPAPEPTPITKPLTAPATEPARSLDETIRMELGSLVDAQAVKPEPAPETASAPEPAAEAPAPEEKPRRGPVWPV